MPEVVYQKYHSELTASHKKEANVAIVAVILRHARNANYDAEAAARELMSGHE